MVKKITTSVFAVAVIATALPGTVRLGSPQVALAQTASTNANLQTIQTLLQQIQTLQVQLNALQTQRKQLVKETTSVILTTLREGSQGDQVAVLQALLAADPELYPEGLITGFYGRLTALAVKRFQRKHGVEQVGFVGPKTLKKLNEFLNQNPVELEDDDDDGDNNGRGIGVSKRVCAKIPPGHLIAPGWLKKRDGVRPIVPTCQKLPPGIVKNPKYSTSTPPAPTSTPDTAAPAISGISASASANSAAVSWTTNEPADSQVFYGSSTAYGSQTTLNTLLVLNHLQALSGLAASTTYHYQALSKDASGNLATSSDQTFTTAAGDTTKPTISSVGVIASSTSAQVLWTTDESATSKVYYGTANPVDPASTSTLFVATTTLATNHSVTLSSLATSTTHYFLIESADAASNTATSSGTFATLAP